MKTTIIKQWLMFRDEIFSNSENSTRYLDMLYYNVHHDGICYYVSGINNNGKIMYIATLEAQDSEEYKEFCSQAKAVNGLYDIDIIFDTAIKILKERS